MKTMTNEAGTLSTSPNGVGMENNGVRSMNDTNFNAQGTPKDQHIISNGTPKSAGGDSTSSHQRRSSSAASPTVAVSGTNAIKCTICDKPYRDPKVLACFHTYCKACLDKLIDSPGKIICPTCQGETQLCPDSGVESLLTDYAVSSLLLQDAAAQDPAHNQVVCTGCKSKDLSAVAYCVDCTNFLCNNCVMAHQYMHCFEGHTVKTLEELDKGQLERPVKCLQHRTENLKQFCFTCNLPVCQACTKSDHPSGIHQCEPINDVGQQQVNSMRTLLERARSKQRTLIESFKTIDQSTQTLRSSSQTAQQTIEKTAKILQELIEEQKQIALKDLEAVHNAKQVSLNMLDRKMQQTMEKLAQTIKFTSRLLDHASSGEVLVFKKLLETRLNAVLNYNPDMNLNNQVEMEFVPNLQAARAAIASTFGSLRHGGSENQSSMLAKPQPIGRPMAGGASSGISINAPVFTPGGANQLPPSGGSTPSLMMAATQNGDLLEHQPKFGSASNLVGSGSGAFMPPSYDTNAGTNYDRWSTAGSDYIMPGGAQNGLDSLGQMSPSAYAGIGLMQAASPPLNPQEVVDLTKSLMQHAGVPLGYPPKSQIKRHKMIYHCKFGEFGVMEGQFTEPSGVTVNGHGDIIIADTNNHRVQVFDKSGQFKFHFGECGKRDGQLLYPNRVAVHRPTGDIIVTERSPTHQIQVYNQYGQFLRKFGANVLQHPRGVCVDFKGRIVIVECKVMRVIIFDLHGNVLSRFGCSKYLEFPNGVCTSDKTEIFISDNRAHCIKVFDYEGNYLRQIGGEGVTNYPIGVGINHLGEIVVADNHNNFNLTIFQQDGTLVNALESKVKHAQCFDVALLDDGSVVLASKDYRLYVYRYINVPQLGI